jgi:antirestriction protein
MIRAIRGELRLSREAFPGNHYIHAALIEEVGELSKALMEHSTSGKITAAELFHEAIQVAAMAIRIGTEGDRDFAYEPYEIFPEENTLP